jgi:hypothetical protein
MEDLAELNSTYNNLINTSNCSNPGGAPFVPAVKIEFVPNIIAINDEYGWNNDNDNNSFGCPGPPWYLDYLDKEIHDNPNIPKGINVYFTVDGSTYTEIVDLNSCTFTQFDILTSCSQSPSRSNLSMSSRVHMTNSYAAYRWHKNCHFWEPWADVKAQITKGFGKGLAHELGHSFNLGHQSCTEGVMAQAGASLRTYISPYELGIMHQAIALTNLRQFIICDETYSTNDYTADRNVTGTEKWDLNVRMYNNVRVKTGAQLTLTCELQMGEPHSIIVERGARLIIDGGLVTKASTCEDLQWWRGIELWGNYNKAQPDPNGALASDDAGVVILKNSASLEEAVVGINTWRSGGGWQLGQDHTGGVIIAESSSQFKNNRKGVAFLKYDSWPNFSKFTDCKFLADDGHPYAGMTIWDTDGVQIDHTYFENHTIAGLLSIDGSFTVKNGSEFFNISHAVEVGSTSVIPDKFMVGLNSNTATRNKFRANTVGVQGNGPKSLFVYNNDFTDYGSYGTAIKGKSTYIIENNNFNDIFIGNQIDETSSNYNHAACNVYLRNVAGIHVLSDNKGFGFDNEVFNSPYDVYMQGSATGVSGEIDRFQGAPGAPRFNSFTTAFNNVFSPTNMTSMFYFHPNPLQSGQQRVPKCALNGGSCGVASAQFYNYQQTGPNQYCYNLGGRGPGGEPPGDSTPVGRLSGFNSQITTVAFPLESGNSQLLYTSLTATQTVPNLYDTLVSRSPYLSDQILRLIIDNTQLSYAEKLDLLNLNSALSKNVLTYAIGKISQQDLDSLNSLVASNPISERATQEMRLQYLIVNRESYIDEYVDTNVLNKTYSQAEQLLDSFPTQENRRRLIAIQFLKNDYQQVSQLIQSYPITNNDDAAFKRVQEAKLELMTVSQSLTLSTTTLSDLYAIANSDLPSSGYARSLLILVDQAIFEPVELVLPPSPLILSNDEDSNIKVVMKSDKLFFPNPTKDILCFNTKSLQKHSLTKVMVFNITGTVVKTYENIYANKLSIHDIPNGLYIFEAYDGDFSLGKEKILIMK